MTRVSLLSQSSPSVVSEPWRFHVKNYGAVGDGKVVNDGAITSGTAALADTTSTPFTSADVGKAILVAGAGAAGAHLLTTISAFTDSGHVTLAANAGTTVSAAVVAYGTDDTTAIKQALAAAYGYAAANRLYAEVCFDDKVYAIAGGLDTSANGYAQIALPYRSSAIATNQIVTIDFRAVRDNGAPENWSGAGGQYLNGATLLSLHPGAVYSGASGVPSLIGGPRSEQTANWSMLNIGLDGIMVSIPLPSSTTVGLAGVDLSQIPCVNAPAFAGSATGTYHKNTRPIPAAFIYHTPIIFPGPGNGNYAEARSLYFSGFYNGPVIYEHANIKRLLVEQCVNALGVGALGHAARIGYFAAEHNQNVILFNPFGGSVGEGPLRIDMLDIEDAPAGSNFVPTYHINDVGNHLEGSANFCRVLGGSGSVFGITNNGARHFETFDIRNSGQWISASALLTANWSAYGGGYSAPAYRKNADGTVTVKGFVKSTGAADTSTILTLPAGFRPAETKNYITYAYSSNSVFSGLLQVGTNGGIAWVLGGATNVVMSIECTFLAEQ